MKRIIEVIILLLTILHFSNGECPKATFDFKNKTTWASYNFIDSSIGNIGSLETCPYTGRPYVYLPCYPNSSWGDEPYFSNCLKPVEVKEKEKAIILDNNPYHNLSIEELAELPIITSNDVSNMLSYLNEETTNFKSSTDVTSVVNIIDRIVLNNQYTDGIQSNLYSIANKLLSLGSAMQMQEAQKMNGSVVKLLSLLDTYSQNFISDELGKSFIENNFAVSIVNRPYSHTKPIIGFEFDSKRNETKPISFGDNHQNSTFIILDTRAIMKQNRLVYSVYNQKNGLFDDKQYHVLTRIISLTIDKPELVKDIGSFVTIHFFIENNFHQENVSCAYWNMFDNMTAQWSTKGCHLSNVTKHSVTCLCDHLTHFAVLMDIEQKSTPRFVQQILSIITLIGLLLSSIGLCLTILTFILFKKLRRHFSQKSLLFLSINLLCVNILFTIISLCTIDQLKHLLCIILAALLHYFILSSFSWMFIMALIQYLLFVKVFSRSISAFTRKAAAFAQFVPLIPVIIILALDPFNYTKRTDKICWLSNLPFYLSFILPIVLYIIINSIIFSIVACSLLCGKTGQQIRSTQIAESQRLSRFFIALSCFVVLGLTWIFGLFTIGSIRLLFQILFCIFASLTGFFIFILYIITSKAKRTCWNNTFKSFGISSIYSPTSSSSSGYLGSKEFSSTTMSTHQKLPSRQLQFPSQPQHFIDAYMPSSPPPPAPPLLPPLQPPLLIEGNDPLYTTSLTDHFYEPRHVWAPQINCIYEANQPSTSLDDYSLFYASNHDATKL